MSHAPDFQPRWRKASFSGNTTNCVEVAVLADGRVAVRHSQDPHGPMVSFSPSEWAAFIKGACHGEFHLDTLGR
jgi:hypothetical protein